jgi:hypothetical protein
MAAERPLVALAENEAADARVDAIRADEKIAPLGAAVAEADLDPIRAGTNSLDLGAKADVGALAHELVERGLKVGPAEQDVTA